MVITDEMLYIGGWAAAAAGLAFCLLVFAVSRIQSKRLNAVLEKEYGEKRKKR